MSNTTRWLLAVLMAVAMFLCIGAVGIMIFAPITFGMTCLVEWLLVIPALMVIVALAGAVQFGMNKPRSRWLGAIIASGVLGVVGYGAWFAAASQLCS